MHIVGKAFDVVSPDSLTGHFPTGGAGGFEKFEEKVAVLFGHGVEPRLRAKRGKNSFEQKLAEDSQFVAGAFLFVRGKVGTKKVTELKPPPLLDVYSMKSLLFAGFCNRLNQMVYSLLNGEGEAVWANNEHLPVSFSRLFHPIEGLEVREGELRHPVYNADPEAGPLFFWYLPKRTEGNPLEIRKAYELVFSSLIEQAEVEARPMIHHRKFHREAKVPVSEFVAKLVTWAQSNFVNSFNGVADGDQEEISLLLQQQGISVNWLCEPMRHDLDRHHFQDVVDYAKAVQASAASPAVLTSFFGSTFIDFALASGVPIVNCGKAQSRGNCRLTVLNQNLPPIRVVSLPSKTKRREQFAQSAEKGGLVYRWQEAIEGARMPLPSWAYLNAGVYGCLYSHAEVFREALRHGWEQITVFEDDAVPGLSFTAMEKELETAPSEADLIYLRKKRDSRLGTWAYIIRARLMKLALERLESDPCPSGRLAHIDQWFLQLENSGLIKAHYLSRDFVYHPVRDVSESTVPWSRHAKSTDWPLEAVVVSPGGMGSTYLIDLLRENGLRVNCRDDSDGLKHSGAIFHHQQKVVFVWNDPLKALFSLDRRGFLKEQFRKLTGGEFNSSLERLLAEEDPLGLVSYARSWAKHPSVLFLDLRESEGDALQDFLNRSDLAIEKRERKVQAVAVSPEIEARFAQLDREVISMFRR